MDRGGTAGAADESILFSRRVHRPGGMGLTAKPHYFCARGPVAELSRYRTVALFLRAGCSMVQGKAAGGYALDRRAGANRQRADLAADDAELAVSR